MCSGSGTCALRDSTAMAQRRPKAESSERTTLQRGLALAGNEAAAIARYREVHHESAKRGPTNTPEKADKPTKPPVPTPRKFQSGSNPKLILRVANSESGGSSSLSGSDCALFTHIHPESSQSEAPQQTVTVKQPPPPVAPKPHRQLKQSPQYENVGWDSRRSTLPQNWKPVTSLTTAKSEDESFHRGKKIHAVARSM